MIKGQSKGQHNSQVRRSTATLNDLLPTIIYARKKKKITCAPSSSSLSEIRELGRQASAVRCAVLVLSPKLALRNHKLQYVSGHFSTGYRSTIGTDFITKTLPHHSNPEESVTLQIWVRTWLCSLYLESPRRSHDHRIPPGKSASRRSLLPSSVARMLPFSSLTSISRRRYAPSIAGGPSFVRAHRSAKRKWRNTVSS
jgi:hypothetical protein